MSTRLLIPSLCGVLILWLIGYQESRAATNFFSRERAATSPTIKNNENGAEYFSFIRIPKTGSTSMMEFLRQQSGLQTLDTVLPNEFVKSKSHHDRGKLVCIYGRPATNTSSSSDSAAHNDDSSEEAKKCAHTRYSSLQSSWEEALPYLDDPKRMEMFTIVREPFDALMSFFYYAKRIDWRMERFTEEQQNLLDEGDLEGWLELFHKEGGHSLQYNHFDSTSVDKAIARLQGAAPKVQVYLSECFEASLRLMEKNLSLEPGAADSFLVSRDFVSNKGNYNRAREELRKKAKKWFADDYKFYDAAVEKFRQQWRSSQMDPSVLTHTCPYLSAQESLRTL